MTRTHSKLMRNAPLVIGSLVIAGLVGCGGQSGTADFTAVLQRAESSDSADPHAITLTAGQAIERSAAASRKIIYTADIELIVTDFQEFEQAIEGLIGRHGGYAAGRKTDRSQGDHRSGTWTIRVPVQNYDALLSGLHTLGFCRSRNETSEDVTETYVDLEARISNQRRLEQRIQAMLDERPGKLSELMELERELARVREEIERMEGRLRVLADQTSLATVHLRVSEESTYQPPQTPGFGDRIAAAWIDSLAALVQIATACTLLVVALLPWCLFLAPAGYLMLRWIRRRPSDAMAIKT